MLALYFVQIIWMSVKLIKSYGTSGTCSGKPDKAVVRSKFSSPYFQTLLSEFGSLLSLFSELFQMHLD